jgi:uncharacterized protein GlcG (DUF336 family)
VNGLLLRAAGAISSVPKLAIAVVDRPGYVLGVYVKGAPTPEEMDLAVGLARTGAFFSNNQAPLSSRTVRFISGLHFPPGVARTPNAALYGIENTNRGCDLDVTWNLNKFLPRAWSLNGLPCNSFIDDGCGTGPVTGKNFATDLAGNPRDGNPSAVNPGGLPIFRGSKLIGGIGVAGLAPGQGNVAEFAAFSSYAADLTPFPVPLPPPQVVFIDGIRLPFVQQTRRPSGVTAGPPGGFFAIPPVDGQCDADGYLVGAYRRHAPQSGRGGPHRPTVDRGGQPHPGRDPIATGLEDAHGHRRGRRGRYRSRGLPHAGRHGLFDRRGRGQVPQRRLLQQPKSSATREVPEPLRKRLSDS